MIRLQDCDDYIYMEKVTLYQMFLELKEEIEKHKWIESEKCGNDVGFEEALKDWMSKHRLAWKKSKEKLY